MTTQPPPAWFRTPSRAFRTAAFWFWHRIPAPEEMVRQLADMRDKGIGTVMIQARPALGLEAYLSDDYLAAYRAACAEARRQGLGITIYDEYGWMSGHGGGRTVRGADHLRERHLFWTSGRPGEDLTITDIRSPFLDFLGEIGRTWLYDGGTPRWGDWRSVLVVAHPGELVDETDLRVLDGGGCIEATGERSCRISIDGAETIPDGWTVTAFVSARCLTSRLVNHLLPEAASRFAETVYAPLLDAAGGSVESIFFDHPHAGFYVWDEHRGHLGNSLLSDGHPATLADAPALLSLARDVGPRTAALRAGFLDAYAGRMHEAFFGTLSRWTRERGVGFTGHELLTHVGGWALHGGLTGFDPRAMPGVDHFGVDAYRTETTVDAADVAPQLSAKLGDSVARANGRKRCSVEQYFTGRPAGRPALAGQWGLTPQRFRAQAIRHILFGARRIILHAVNVTDGFDDDDRLLANPRFDFPPAFNFEPWWEDGPAIFAELARLSAFLEDGDPVRPVALLYPLETIRTEGPSHACGQEFGFWAEALAQTGLGYDIVDERGLAEALGPETHHQTLVLPAVTALSAQASIEAILGFVTLGGRLLASGSPLGEMDRKGGRADLSNLSALFTAGDENAAHRPGGSAKAIRACVAGLPRPMPDARFLDDGPTWATTARCGEDWRIAVFNDREQARSLSVDIGPSPIDVAFWNPDTGEWIEDLDIAILETGFLCRVEAQRVLCITVRPGISSDGGIQHRSSRSDPNPDASTAPIVLAEGWTLQIADEEPRPVAVDRGWECQGLGTFSGTGIYRRTVRLPDTGDDLVWHLVLPAVHETAELWIDGRLAGRHIAGEARFALPCDPGADIAIELRVRNTAANRYLSGTAFDTGTREPSGLTAPPLLIARRPHKSSMGPHSPIG